MNPPEQYSVLIVEPSDQASEVIRNSLASSHGEQQLLHAPNLSVAAKQLETHDGDVLLVFLSRSFGKTDITDFIAAGKMVRTCQDATFALLLDSDEELSSSLASNLYPGVDLTCDRSSISTSLDAMFQEACKRRQERMREREKRAMEFLLNELMIQLNEFAAVRKTGGAAAISWYSFKEMAGVLGELDDELKDVYFDLLLTAFPEFPVIDSSKLRVLVPDESLVMKKLSKKEEAA